MTKVTTKDMKSYTRCRLVPKSTTLDDLEMVITHSVSKHVHHDIVIYSFLVSHSICF